MKTLEESLAQLTRLTRETRLRIELTRTVLSRQDYRDICNDADKDQEPAFTDYLLGQGRN